MTKRAKVGAGRTAHTPEPWYAVGFQVETDNEDPNVPDICNCWPVTFDQRDTRSAEEIEANVRRIVVCVNACKGIPNEQLEMDSAAFIDVFNAYNRLRRQHGVLLGALREIAAETTIDGTERDDLCAIIQGICRKATGGKA